MTTLKEQIEQYLEENEVPHGISIRAMARNIAKGIDSPASSVMRTIYTHNINDRIKEEANDFQEPSEATLREMKADYSAWPGQPGMTMRELAQKYNLPETQVKALRKKYGWTHASSPVLDSDLLGDLSDEEIDSFIINREEQKVAGRHFARQQREIERDAERWRELKHSIQPFYEMLPDVRPIELPERTKKYFPSSSRLVVLHPTDIHLGKMAADGVGMEATVEALHDTNSRLAGRFLLLDPKEIVITVGNDWFHVDSDLKTTTRGTPQDVCAPIHEIVGTGYKAAIDLIDFYRAEKLRVKVVVVRSNHDSFATAHLGFALQYVYANVEGVEIVHSHRIRQYMQWGKNLLGFTHGHGAKETKLPQLMANEASQLWSDTLWRYWVTGHLHHSRHVSYETDNDGVHILQGPSISLTDKWHEDQGYTMASKAMVAYTFHSERGHEDRMLANVEVSK